MYTKLDLVNACLRAIGNEQVPDLDFPDVDTDTAIVTVEETVVDVLSRGWWFNTETHWKLSPNKMGEIQIPSTVIAFTTERDSLGLPLVRREGKAYHTKEHTFKMAPFTSSDGTIDFDFILALTIENCPTPAQQYIRRRAITRFLMDNDAEPAKISKSENAELILLATLERYHRRSMNTNAYNSPRVSKFMSSISSVNSGYATGSNPLGGGSDV